MRKSKYLKVKFLIAAFDDVDHFFEAFRSFNLSEFDHHGFYVFIFTNQLPINKSSIFETMWRKSFYNVNILTKGPDNSVELSTFFPFQKNICHSTKSIIINKFNNYTWRSSEFFPKKLNNFHKCPLTVGSHGIVARFERVQNVDGTFDYDGSDALLIKLLAGALNFHMNVNYSLKPFDWGSVYADGSASGVAGQVIHGKSDMIIGTYFLQYIRAAHMDFTDAYFIMPEMVIVPAGAPFTSIENLIRPFSLTVWLALIATIAWGYGCNFAFNLLPKPTRVLICDRKMLMSLPNFCAVIFGEAVSKPPRRSPARFFLIAFVMMCLVMRTVYQARMFIFFQAGHSKKIVKDFDDMERGRFKFYSEPCVEGSHIGKLNYPDE